METLEILKPDIFGFQECDNFKVFYQKEISSLGYDCVFEERPEKSDGKNKKKIKIIKIIKKNFIKNKKK